MRGTGKEPSLLDAIKSYDGGATTSNQVGGESTLSLLMSMAGNEATDKSSNIVTVETIEKLKATAHWGENDLPLTVVFDRDVIKARARIDELLHKVDEDESPPVSGAGGAAMEHVPENKTAKELSFERLRVQEAQQQGWDQERQNRDKTNVRVQNELMTQEALRLLQNMKRDELTQLRAVVNASEQVSPSDEGPNVSQARARIDALTRSGHTRSRGFER